MSTFAFSTVSDETVNCAAKSASIRATRAALNLAVEFGLRPSIAADDWLELREKRRVQAVIDLRDPKWPRAVRVFVKARDMVNAAKAGDLCEVLR
jgi:hypothetical protein